MYKIYRKLLFRRVTVLRGLLSDQGLGDTKKNDLVNKSKIYFLGIIDFLKELDLLDYSSWSMEYSFIESQFSYLNLLSLNG